MSKICKFCGFENNDSDKKCLMCDEPLEDTQVVKPAETQAKPAEAAPEKTEKQVQPAAGVSRYFVRCDTCRTKTYVEGPGAQSFYCKTCKETFEIDGFLVSVEKETAEPAENSTAANTAPAVKNASAPDKTIEEKPAAPAEPKLILEDVDSHYILEITQKTGTLGRYGSIGSDYFLNHPKGRFVSGEHCRIFYEYGRWYIEHMSRTNDTVIKSANSEEKKLERENPEPLRNGRRITLANAITFLVRSAE